MNILSKKTKTYKKRRPQKLTRSSHTQSINLFIKCGGCAIKAVQKVGRKYPGSLYWQAGCDDAQCEAPHLIQIQHSSRYTIDKLLRGIAYEFISNEELAAKLGEES